MKYVYWRDECPEVDIDNTQCITEQEWARMERAQDGIWFGDLLIAFVVAGFVGGAIFGMLKDGE